MKNVICVDRIHDSLRPWQPILMEWAELIARYVKCYERDGVATDVPYCYNERATLSTFVGAIWLTENSMALEEYRVQRDRPDTATTGWGRADLWFRTGGNEYAVEAKSLFPATARRLDEKVKQLLVSGCEQAKSSKQESHVTRVGVVFVCPSISPSKAASLDDELNNTVNSLRRCEPDLLAWYCPPEARKQANPDYMGRIFPGVFLVGRLA